MLARMVLDHNWRRYEHRPARMRSSEPVNGAPERPLCERAPAARGVPERASQNVRQQAAPDGEAALLRCCGVRDSQSGHGWGPQQLSMAGLSTGRQRKNALPRNAGSALTAGTEPHRDPRRLHAWEEHGVHALRGGTGGRKPPPAGRRGVVHGPSGRPAASPAQRRAGRGCVHRRPPAVRRRQAQRASPNGSPAGIARRRTGVVDSTAIHPVWLSSRSMSTS